MCEPKSAGDAYDAEARYSKAPFLAGMGYLYFIAVVLGNVSDCDDVQTAMIEAYSVVIAWCR